MFRFVISFFIIFLSFNSYAEEKLLTLEQRLDRLQRDVNDLSKLVYQNNIKDNGNSEQNFTENAMDISAFDMRIYDLEKDIKSLNSSFEDLVFELDETKKMIEELNIRLDNVMISSFQNQNTTETSLTKIEETENEENTLGTLVINSEDLSEGLSTQNKTLNEKTIEKLTPEEQFQKAFDLLRSQKFDQAKKALREFIDDNEKNEFSGSAHYWLGEIYLLQKDYREAALIFAEGYQKYPNSIKAPDNLYKLADALSNIDKQYEACDTLKKFLKEHSAHKLFKKTKNKIQELKCE